MSNEKTAVEQATRMAEFATQLANAVIAGDNNMIALNVGRVHGASDVMKASF